MGQSKDRVFVPCCYNFVLQQSGVKQEIRHCLEGGHQAQTRGLNLRSKREMAVFQRVGSLAKQKSEESAMSQTFGDRDRED